MSNTSIFNAFERMWFHVITALSDKADKVHEHSYSWNDLEDKPFDGNRVVLADEAEYKYNRDNCCSSLCFVPGTEDVSGISVGTQLTVRTKVGINDYQFEDGEAVYVLEEYTDDNGTTYLAANVKSGYFLPDIIVVTNGSFSQQINSSQWYANSNGIFVCDFSNDVFMNRRYATIYMGEVKTLDEQFIPNSIARTTDVDVVADALRSHEHSWNELNDVPEHTYERLLDRPFYDDREILLSKYNTRYYTGGSTVTTNPYTGEQATVKYNRTRGFHNTITLNPQKRYSLTINGVRYENCPVVTGDKCYAIGINCDEEWLKVGFPVAVDTSKPCYAIYRENNGGYQSTNLRYSTDVTETTFVISLTCDDFKQLDPKYLPDESQFGEVRKTIMPLIHVQEDGNEYVEFPEPISLEAGKKYIVVINGEEQEWTAFWSDDAGEIVLGYTGEDVSQGTVNYPMGINSTGAYWGDGDGSMGAIESFAVYQDIIATIDPKYLPDNLAKTEDIPEHTWESLPDKPFGEEAVKENIFAQTVVVGDFISGYTPYDEPYYVAYLYDYPMLFAIGDVVSVVYDGVTYTLTAIANKSEQPCLTDAVVKDETDLFLPNSAGVPFVLTTNISNTNLLCLASGEHTVEIHRQVITVHTIDPKYLPDTVADITYVDTQINDLQTAVDEIQEITSEEISALFSA